MIIPSNVVKTTFPGLNLNTAVFLLLQDTHWYSFEHVHYYRSVTNIVLKYEKCCANASNVKRTHMFYLKVGPPLNLFIFFVCSVSRTCEKVEHEYQLYI